MLMLSSRKRNVRVALELHLDNDWTESALVSAARARRRGVFHSVNIPKESAERGFLNFRMSYLLYICVEFSREIVILNQQGKTNTYLRTS